MQKRFGWYTALLLKLVAVFLISFSAFAGNLTYPSNADFSDIFKGYGIKKEGGSTKKLNDDLQPLSELNCSETVQIAKLLPDDFDKIRKFEIIPNDKSFYSSVIAKCILEKILVLFKHRNSPSFAFYDTLGKYVSTDEQKISQWVKNCKLTDTIANFQYESHNLSNEQTCFILSIRQAILKIAQNPVGRRLFLRIFMFSLIPEPLLENLVVTIPWLTETVSPLSGSDAPDTKSESQSPTAQSTASTSHMELAHIPTPSTFARPGSGAKLASTWKQTSIRKNEIDSSEAKIIGENGQMKDDVKPFYLSFCHELIHALHKLENTTVDLGEQETNKRAFELVYKVGIWEKNLDALDAGIIGTNILNNFTKELAPKIANDINRSIDFIIFLHHHGADEEVIDFMIERFLSTCNENEGYIKPLIERVDSYQQEDLFTKKMPYTGEHFGTKQNEIRKKLIKSFIKNICLSKLEDIYIKDYKNGEEFYTVMGLRYNNKKLLFEIDNVSEMTFNAFELNEVMRVSYDSEFILSSAPKSILLDTFVSKLKSSLEEEKVIIDAKFVLGILTGKEKTARIDGCLETSLQEQIGIKEDLFFW